MADTTMLGTMLTTTNLAVFAGGLLLGGALGFVLSPARGLAKRLRADLDRTLKDHEEYRASVDSHFRKTADLVGTLTKSYAAVYDHLATGARQFCGEEGSDREVTMRPLPSRLEAGGGAASTASTTASSGESTAAAFTASSPASSSESSTGSSSAGSEPAREAGPDDFPDATAETPDADASLDSPSGTTTSAATTSNTRH